MRKVDEANTAARRATIISAGIQCLARNGVAKTSINDICREAGMRSGHLYYYFENKDAVLVAILLAHRERTVEAIEHMFDDEGDLAAQIIDIHVDAENRRAAAGLTPILSMELECYVSRLESHGIVNLQVDNESMAETLRLAVRHAIARGRLPKDIDVVQFASAIGLIWDGITHSRLASNFDLEKTREAVQCLMAPWSRRTSFAS